MRPVSEWEHFRTDPLSSRYEVNFKLPGETHPGGHVLEISMGKRLLARMWIEVVA